MTEKEMEAKITQAHIDGYNRGFAKAENKIADIKANCDLAIEGRDIKIKELEQENEKLKSEKGCETCTKFDEVQLTKAKELLERLVTVCKIVPLGTNYDVVKKAEQFLKEIEK